MRKLPLVVLASFAGGLTAALVFTLHNGVRAGSGLAPTDKNGDVNGDGQLDISDAVYTLVHLFKGGPEPVACADSPDLLARVASLESRLASLDNVAGRVPSIESRVFSLEERNGATALQTIVSAWNGQGRFTHDQRFDFWLGLQDPGCCNDYGKTELYLTGATAEGRGLQFQTPTAGHLLIRLSFLANTYRLMNSFHVFLDGVLVDHAAYCQGNRVCLTPDEVSFEILNVAAGSHVLEFRVNSSAVDLSRGDEIQFVEQSRLDDCRLIIELQPAG